jgi:quinol monooxygenase YgiN
MEFRVGGAAAGSVREIDMQTAKTGFAVIYRWRLHAGKEAQFQEAWAAVTRLFMAERGARGSRLHQSEDGIWLAYAQWPDKRAWEASRAAGPADSQSAVAMSDAIAESFAPILLRPVADHLLAG